MAFEVSKVTGYGKQTIEALKYAGGTDPALAAQVVQNTTDIATANGNITNLSQELNALDARVETSEDAITRLEGDLYPKAKQVGGNNSLSYDVPTNENVRDCVVILPLLATACQWDTSYKVAFGNNKYRQVLVSLPARTATTTKAYLYLKREGGCIQPYIRLNGTGADTDAGKCIVVGTEDVYASGTTVNYNYIEGIYSSIKDNPSPGVYFTLRYSYTTRS